MGYSCSSAHATDALPDRSLVSRASTSCQCGNTAKQCDRLWNNKCNGATATIRVNACTMHDTVILWPHTVRTRSGASQSDAATRSGARRRAVLLAMLRCAAALFLSVLTNQTEPNSDSQEQLAKVGASQYLLEYCAVLLIGTEARATPARPRQAVATGRGAPLVADIPSGSGAAPAASARASSPARAPTGTPER